MMVADQRSFRCDSVSIVGAENEKLQQIQLPQCAQYRIARPGLDISYDSCSNADLGIDGSSYSETLSV